MAIMLRLLIIFSLFYFSLVGKSQGFVPFIAQQGGGNGLLNNLVAYWAFEEASGNALDSSGNSKTLTMNGTLGVNPTGLVGKARNYSSTDNTDYFSRASEAAFTFGSGSFTITGWINMDLGGGAITDDMTLIAKSDVANLISWWIVFDHGTIDSFQFYYSSSGVMGPVLQASIAGDLVRPSVWYFLAVRYNGTEIHFSATPQDALALNSDVTVSFPGPFYNNSSTPLTVGTVMGDTLHDLGGLADEIGVWNVYLNDCQLNKLFLAKSGSFTYANFDALTCLP